MWSIHDYCDITEKERADRQHAVFQVSLNADCKVYEGHFPGKPVCPGVCNIATVKACAAMLLHRELAITTIKQCRLTALATPGGCPTLTVSVEVKPIDDGYEVVATMSDTVQTYLMFRGTMSALA